MRSRLFAVLATCGPLAWLPVAAASPAESQRLFLFDRSSQVLSIGHYEITAAWRDFDGNGALAEAVAMTASSGYFTFFSADNVEIVVKRHQGCALNGHDWFFFSGVTNVEVTITVRDTVTGATKVYHNPLNAPFSPILDTSAFPSCEQSVSATLGPQGGSVTSADGRLQLTVPPGALSQNVTLEISELPVGGLGAPLDAVLTGLPLEKVYLLEPDGLQFAAPVAIRYASEQSPTETAATTFGSAGQLLLLSDDSQIELLDSRTVANTQNDRVEVRGSLEHFTLLSVSNSSAANGVGFFLMDVPQQLEVGESFTATAVIAGNQAPTGHQFVTAVGPATYEDSTSAPLRADFAPLTQQVPPSAGKKERWEGKFSYTCTAAGLAMLEVELAVAVQVKFPGSPAETATSFDEFIGFVRCVTPAEDAKRNLAVLLDGSGSGAISDNLGEIACGDDCSGDYPVGTAVTLVATPGEGSTFLGWSGACTGAGACNLTLDADRVVTAIFEQQPAGGCAVLSGDYFGSGQCGISSGPVEVSFAGSNLSLHPFGTNGPTEFAPETDQLWVSQDSDLIILLESGHSCQLVCGAPYHPPGSFAVQCSRPGFSCQEVFTRGE